MLLSTAQDFNHGLTSLLLLLFTFGLCVIKKKKKKIIYAVFIVCLHFVNKHGVEEEPAVLSVVTSGRGKKSAVRFGPLPLLKSEHCTRSVLHSSVLHFIKLKEVCDFDGSYSVFFHDHTQILFPSSQLTFSFHLCTRYLGINSVKETSSLDI